MTLVEVEWLDSHVEAEWRTVEDVRKRADYEDALRNYTVGHLLLDEPGYVVLAQTRTPSDAKEPPLYGNTTQIPRCAIVAVRSVTVGRKRR